MSSPAFYGLSADQTQRYLSARQRFLSISSASTNGTPITTTTNGAMAPGASTAPPTSTGFTRFTDEFMLAHYEKTLSAEGRDKCPPLDSYRTETEKHGEVYIATHEYREWFRRTYPGAIIRSDCPRPAPSSDPARPRGKDEMTF